MLCFFQVSHIIMVKMEGYGFPIIDFYKKVMTIAPSVFNTRCTLYLTDFSIHITNGFTISQYRQCVRHR